NNYKTLNKKGSFTFSAPSNIALVKYWGKKEHQIPANPSLSFTLNHCKTITTLKFEPKTEKSISFDLLFEGQPKESFRPKINNYKTLNKKGSFTFSAPSNIALVKYWGKKEHQIPANPSLSFTLNHCKTITTLKFEPKTEKSISFDLLFEGQPKESFRPKIQKY